MKGDPERPLWEPVLALFAATFHLHQVFVLSRHLSIFVPVEGEELNPYYYWWGYMWNYMANTILGLFWLSIIAMLIIILGALVMYRFNRRVGGAFILLISIVTLLPGFFFLILGPSLFLGSILGLIAGGLGTRGDEEPATTAE